MGITDLDNHIICHLIWTLSLYICIPHLWGGPSHIFGLLWGLRFVNKKIYCPKFINCRKVVSCNQCQSVNFEYAGKDASLSVNHVKMSFYLDLFTPASIVWMQRVEVWRLTCVMCVCLPASSLCRFFQKSGFIVFIQKEEMLELSGRLLKGS